MTYAFDEAEALLWAGLKAAGILRRARATFDDCGTLHFDVELVRPDIRMMDDAIQSTDWAIEYVHAEVPAMAKGTEVWIEEPGHVGIGRLFKVREAPRVEEGGTGYFRQALLTEQECDE